MILPSLLQLGFELYQLGFELYQLGPGNADLLQLGSAIVTHGSALTQLAAEVPLLVIGALGLCAALSETERPLPGVQCAVRLLVSAAGDRGSGAPGPATAWTGVTEHAGESVAFAFQIRRGPARHQLLEPAAERLPLLRYKQQHRLGAERLSADGRAL